MAVVGWNASDRDMAGFFDSVIYEDLRRELLTWADRAKENLLDEADQIQIYRNQGRATCMVEFAEMLDIIKTELVGG